MAAKIPFKGSKVEWDSTGGTTWATLGDLAGLMPPQKKRRIADSTVADSANDYREHLPHYKEGGSPKARFRLHKTQFALLDTAFEADTIPNWRFSIPLLSGETTPSRWTFLAIIEDLGIPERSVDDDNVYDVEVTLMITGKPTFAAGS